MLEAPEQFETTTRGPFARSFVDGEIDSQTATWVENNLTQADVTEIRTHLEDLAPDFAHLGRQDWLDYALRVLDVIQPYATGTRNLIAEG